MATSAAVTRILWHAGLPSVAPGEELRPGSMSRVTWELAGVVEACEDLLHALEQLNVEVNGAVPSEVGMDSKANDLPRKLVWAVEVIKGDLVEALQKGRTESVRDPIALSIDKVTFWWKSVLDGDIDDIPGDWEVYLQSR